MRIALKEDYTITIYNNGRTECCAVEEISNYSEVNFLHYNSIWAILERFALFITVISLFFNKTKDIFIFEHT